MTGKFFLYVLVTILVIWAMDSVNINQIFKKNKILQARVFYFLLGISLIFGVIGYLVASLGINKITQKVSSTFSYSFPTTYYYAKEAVFAYKSA